MKYQYRCVRESRQPVLAYMMDMCGVQDYCIRDVLASIVVQSEHGVLWKM